MFIFNEYFLMYIIYLTCPSLVCSDPIQQLMFLYSQEALRLTQYSFWASVISPAAAMLLCSINTIIMKKWATGNLIWRTRKEWSQLARVVCRQHMLSFPRGWTNEDKWDPESNHARTCFKAQEYYRACVLYWGKQTRILLDWRVVSRLQTTWYRTVTGM